MVSRRDCWNVTLPARIPPRTDRVQIAMEKVTKSSTNHLIRLNGTPDFETDRTTLLQHAYLYRAMYKFSMCRVSLSAEVFPYMLCYPAEEPLYPISDRSGECSKEWRSDQRGSRNAAKFGGHNIFPMGPEVVVRPARPPSLDCRNSFRPWFHIVRMLLSHTDGCETSCIKNLSFPVGRAAAMQQNSAHTSRIRRQSLLFVLILVPFRPPTGVLRSVLRVSTNFEHELSVTRCRPQGLSRCRHTLFSYFNV